MEISLNVDTAATFFPGKRTAVTVWAGSWVSHRSCLDGWVTCPVLMGESHVLSWWVSHMSGLDGWVTGPLLMGESQVFSWWVSHRSSLDGWVTGPVLMGESHVLSWWVSQCPVLMGESQVLSWWVSHMFCLDGWVTCPALMGEPQLLSWWVSHISCHDGWVTCPVLMGESQVLFWCYSKKTNRLLLPRLNLFNYQDDAPSNKLKIMHYFGGVLRYILVSVLSYWLMSHTIYLYFQAPRRVQLTSYNREHTPTILDDLYSTWCYCVLRSQEWNFRLSNTSCRERARSPHFTQSTGSR